MREGRRDGQMPARRNICLSGEIGWCLGRTMVVVVQVKVRQSLGWAGYDGWWCQFVQGRILDLGWVMAEWVHG